MMKNKLCSVQTTLSDIVNTVALSALGVMAATSCVAPVSNVPTSLPDHLVPSEHATHAAAAIRQAWQSLPASALPGVADHCRTRANSVTMHFHTTQESISAVRMGGTPGATTLGFWSTRRDVHLLTSDAPNSVFLDGLLTELDPSAQLTVVGIHEMLHDALFCSGVPIDEHHTHEAMQPWTFSEGGQAASTIFMMQQDELAVKPIGSEHLMLAGKETTPMKEKMSGVQK